LPRRNRLLFLGVVGPFPEAMTGGGYGLLACSVTTGVCRFLPFSCGRRGLFLKDVMFLCYLVVYPVY
jgi:hypothetical protein